ncbi:MAG: hypothetical protein Q9165_005240 [Trypethelium subeluteriae]
MPIFLTTFSLVCALLVASARASCSNLLSVSQCPAFSDVATILPLPNDFEESNPPKPLRSSSGNEQIDIENTMETQKPLSAPFNRLGEQLHPICNDLEEQFIFERFACYELVLDTSDCAVHKAPVYVPELDSIIFSQAFDQFSAPASTKNSPASLSEFDDVDGMPFRQLCSKPKYQEIFDQQIIDLSGGQPRRSNFTTSPPTYGVNGGKHHNGSIYWAVEGGFVSSSARTGQTKHNEPGIYRLDPSTGHVEMLLNGFQGKRFSSPHDLVIDSHGDIWFTDSQMTSGSATRPDSNSVLPSATYRFRPSTGEVSIVESTLIRPHASGISPDGRKLYITDRPVPDWTVPDWIMQSGAQATILYAFDIEDANSGGYLATKRQLWWSIRGLRQGLQVTHDGKIFGLDEYGGLIVMDTHGERTMTSQMNAVSPQLQPTSMAFVGENKDEIWLLGTGGIGKLRLKIMDGWALRENTQIDDSGAV